MFKQLISNHFLAFQTYGVNLDQPAVAMCSIGMRASILVLGAHILGKQVPLYDVRRVCVHCK